MGKEKEVFKLVMEYLKDQANRRNKGTFADQRAGSDAEDVLIEIGNIMEEEKPPKAIGERYDDDFVRRQDTH